MKLTWSSRTWVQVVCLFFLVALTITAHAETEHSEQDNKPLILGVFPLVSTVALYKRFSPLTDYLAESLGREIVLLTAKDFPTFFERTAQRQYDIVITAPHFAVSAADSGKYRIRATLTSDVQQLIVIKNDSPIKRVQQLANMKIATPPEGALMTMMGKRFLADAGLTDDKQPIYRSFTSHNAANEALLGGEVDAAIASTNIILKAIKAGEPLMILSRGLRLPNMATMVATDRDEEIGEQLVKILTTMTNSEKGQQILKSINFPGYRAVDAKDYEPARPYMEQLQTMSK